MLLRAVNDDCWSVMMFGFHMMHQRARKELFPQIIEHNIGTLQMFVVRNIFSQPDYLQNTMKTLAAEGKVPAEIAEKDNPLDFLVHEGGASSLTDAAYRFVRHQPGVSVVLFGTGSVDHLEANIDSILKPPLPAEDPGTPVRVVRRSRRRRARPAGSARPIRAGCRPRPAVR